MTDSSWFNLCTSTQSPQVSYYLLKESIRTHKDIKRVFFEVSISRLAVDPPNQTGTFIVTDYMESDILRLETIMSSFGPEVYVNGFSRLRRTITPTKMPGLKKIIEIYNKKKTDKYKNYDTDSDYRGRGQWHYSGWIGNKGEIAVNIDSKTKDTFSKDNLKDEPIRYLYKIIELCKKNNIELVFCYFPYTEMCFMNSERYEDITGVINGIAEDADVPVLDFNLVKDEYMHYDISDYYNFDHLNSSKCGQITDFLLMYINDPDGDYFCKSIREKYPAKDYVMFAGYTRKVIDGEMRVDISAGSYVDIPVYVKLYSMREDSNGDYSVSKEYTPTETDAYHSAFSLPYDNYKTYYKIELYDPGSGKLLYTAYTYFGMD